MPKFHAPYPAEFRQQMVELVRVGRSPPEVAGEFGCPDQTIRNWVAHNAIDSGKPLPGKDGLTTPSGRSCRACAGRCGNWTGEVQSPTLSGLSRASGPVNQAAQISGRSRQTDLHNVPQLRALAAQKTPLSLPRTGRATAPRLRDRRSECRSGALRLHVNAPRRS